MKSARPVLLAVRLTAAVAASLSIAASGFASSAAAAPSRGAPAYIDRGVLEHAADNPSGTVRVIITRDHNGDSDGAVNRRGGRVINDLHLADATVAEVPASQVQELANQPGVARVSYDAPVTLQAVDPLSLGLGQLQTVYPLAVDAASQWNTSRHLRGTGIGVAVLDSGVDAANADFLGGGLHPVSRVPKLFNAIGNGGASDDNGHGTFVAGIIGGRGYGVPGLVSAGSYVGVAPDANIISVKVADSHGMSYVSDVIAGIEWATQHRRDYNIRVINLSLVSNVADSYTTDLLDAAVELAWLQGVVVVVAAGNAGPNAPITSPANDPFVITVGATDDHATASTADDTLAAFSSYGKTADGLAKPDLVAPGRRIISTLSSPRSPLAAEFPTRVLGGGHYIQLSGTSASAPVISGVVAQLLQARPNLTPGQVKWLLTHTALPVAGAGTGAGYPRVGAAVNYSQAIGSTNPRLPNLYLALAYATHLGKTVGSVAWNDVAWNDVAWNDVAWNDVAWNDVAWNDVAWNDVAWNDVAWND
jgi:serine protease AprX